MRFEKINKTNGLSTLTIYDICQDNLGFLWFATAEGLNRYDGYSIKIYKHDPIDKNSISNNFIRKIFLDHDGKLWIGTDGGGLNIYDRENDQFICYRNIPGNPNSLSNDNVYAIIEDSQEDLWIGTFNGLNKFDKKNKIFTQYYHSSIDPDSISDNLINTIYEDRRKDIWVGTDNGLNKWVRSENKFINFLHNPLQPNSISNNKIYSLIEDMSGFLWIATEDYLNQLNLETMNVILYKKEPDNPNSINDNFIIKLYIDHLGNLWIGTMNQGLYRYNFVNNQFYQYKNNKSDPLSLSDNFVLSIYEDKSGILWIGTYNNGINKYDPKKQCFNYNIINNNDSNLMTDTYVRAICKDKYNYFWIGTNEGLNRINPITREIKQYKSEPNNPYSLSDNRIYTIYEDSYGELWIGTLIGLNKYLRKNDSFKQYKANEKDPTKLIHNKVVSLYEDDQKNLLIANKHGINTYNRQDDTFSRYFTKYLTADNIGLGKTIYSMIKDTDDTLLGGSFYGLQKLNLKTQEITYLNKDISVWCIYKDHSNHIWLGTSGNGLVQFDQNEEKFIYYTEKDGLSNNTIFGILEDEKGNLWLSTINGLSRFDPELKKFKNYYIEDGLVFNEFNLGAYYKEQDGKMFFGGINGLISFYPDQLLDDRYIPPIIITDFLLNNQSVKVNKSGILKKSINIEKKLIIPYNEKAFSFEFSALNFSASSKNQYAYQLEGFDKQWNYLGNRHLVTYTNLFEGNYTLHIKGSNKDGKWNEEGTSLKIKITPPYWRSWWAYCFYLLIITGTIIFIIRFILKRQAEIYQQRMKTTEINHLKKVNEQKTNFFINIAHETKTPLSLMKNYLEKEIRERGGSENLKIVKKNLDKLHIDITNFMDLEKIEKSHIVYRHNQITDISQIILEKIFMFKEIIKRKGLELKNSIQDHIYAKIDLNAFDRIINNLIDNAIKYTEQGYIEITLKADDWYFYFSVMDTGLGIPEKQLVHIFEPYYQVSDEKRNIQGLGMGLNIVKKIIDELNGEITVDTKEKKGSCFTIRLEKYKLKDGDQIVSGKLSTPIDRHCDFLLKEEKFIDGKKTLLLVEDNLEMLTYLQNSLMNQFNIYYAKNGLDALDKVKNIPKPDLIVSDIMMDEMDGYEFYKNLIMYTEYQSVPFIFLTAKTSFDEKLKALQSGVIDFIIKPFNIEELKAKITSILNIHRILKKENLDHIGEILSNHLTKIGTLKKNDYIEQPDTPLDKTEKLNREYNISPREIEIIALMKTGQEYKGIAEKLNIKLSTVKTHIKRLFEKCKVNNKIELLNIISKNDN